MRWVSNALVIGLTVAACGGRAAPPPEHAKEVANSAPVPAPAPDSVAIAIVFNGQEIWVGNDDIETDENARYAGALKHLETAIDAAKLASAGGAGSKAVVVSYSTGAELRVPMLDLDKLGGSALGSQKDYRGKIGTDLIQGIVMAQAELSRATAAHKAMIVIGDGNDTNDETAASELRRLAAELKTQKVGVFAIVYKSAVSSEGDVIHMIAPGLKTVNSADGFAAELVAIMAKVRAE